MKNRYIIFGGISDCIVFHIYLLQYPLTEHKITSVNPKNKFQYHDLRSNKQIYQISSKPVGYLDSTKLSNTLYLRKNKCFFIRNGHLFHVATFDSSLPYEVLIPTSNFKMETCLHKICQFAFKYFTATTLIQLL